MYNAQTLQWDMRFDNMGQMWYEVWGYEVWKKDYDAPL